jgi:iron(III) transport system ATP-binding protein
MASIQIAKLSKRYGAVTAVRELDLEVGDGEFVTLLGPSGCGKTTVLRCLAGFLVPDGGTIRVGGQAVSSPEGVVPPERRGMGMVFQNYAVWPHKTVYENVVFGLEVRKLPKAEARQRVGRVLELVNLAGLEARYPSQLSGGQQQRVALARSLVVEPGILLLDEPLSNLDAKLRERMRWELKELQRRTAITFVYVTHDQAEAMALSDRIAVMHAGELLQYGPPREVYARPATRTVADFMGLVNLLPGRVLRSAGGEVLVALAGDRRLRVARAAAAREGEAVQVAIRPENVALGAGAPEAGSDDTAALPATVTEITFLGSITDCVLTLEDGTRLRVQGAAIDGFRVGERVWARFDSQHATVFPA